MNTIIEKIEIKEADTAENNKRFEELFAKAMIDASNIWAKWNSEGPESETEAYELNNHKM